MTEYIEREALMRRIKEIHCAECDSYHGVRCRACWVDDTLDYIDSEPTVDVAPVRHGRWIHERTEGGFHIWRCNQCGRGMNANPEGTDLYCYHCGAKMDGGDDE